jgi:dihydrofolate synthase / folylpolyglutamate synthase
MTYSDSIQFLHKLRWFGARFSLANTFKLAALAGNPQKQLRFIHVAGTNGKGSTCAMLESIYRAAGLRTGLFTSPHLVAFGERFQVNRQVISESNISRLVTEMRSLLHEGWGVSETGSQSMVSAQDARLRGPGAAPSGDLEHPTFFEVVTVMALRYFAEQECDLVIWETGLGGRLDATNIVMPLASVITNIQYDHQKWLGETLASIAFEKSGIIKFGVPIITGANAPEAVRVIEKTALKENAPLTRVPVSAIGIPPLDTLQLPLPGRHQTMNAAVALAAVQALAPQIPVSCETIQAGLSSFHWPGRLQLVTRPSGRRLLLDGAHNIGGARVLAAALREYFPSSKPTLVLGILRDKDWPAMCRILAPLARRILLVPVHSAHTAEPHGLAEVSARANPHAQVLEYSSLQGAFGDAAQDSFVAITGSMCLVGEAMELLQLSPAKSNDERGLNEWRGASESGRLVVQAIR